MTKEEIIKKIEETASDTFINYMEENPIEDRFDAPDMILNFGLSLGQYYASLQFLYWVPFEVWRITHKEGYKKYVEMAKKKEIGIHEAILDDILDKALLNIYKVIGPFLPRKDKADANEL